MNPLQFLSWPCAPIVVLMLISSFRFPHPLARVLLALMRALSILPSVSVLDRTVLSPGTLACSPVHIQVEGVEERISKNKIVISQASEEEMHGGHLSLMAHLQPTVVFHFSFLVFSPVHIINGKQSL